MTHIKEDPLLNEDEEYWENIDVNDCNYLLRTLEREAFSSVISALRAKGPPSEHTFLLLNHLKSALSISDELGRAEIRKASVDPRLCKLAKILNPNYDTCTEWSTCSLECRSLVGTKPSRTKPFANTSSSSVADQLLNQASARNDNVNRSSARAFELLSLPHRPFVPERLRLLLRETDRPEQRIALPFEPVLTSPVPVPVPVPVEKSIPSDDQPPTKKRKQRTSKGARIRETPPELLPQKTLVLNDEISKKLIEAVSTLEAAAAAKAPKTPVAASAATPATPVATPAVAATPSVTVGSGGSGIMSPSEPPQSGDAMKTWVSKIHEQEMAASAAKRNGGTITISPVELCAPSTSSGPSTEDSEKKKKRRSSKPTVDPYYLNTSARTRPFQFDKGEGSVNGHTNPPRPNPEKRAPLKHASPGIHSYHTPHSASGSISNMGLATPSTPIARPDVYHGHGHLNGRLEDSPAVLSSMPSILKAAAAASPSRAPMKRPHPIVNTIRVPPKYIVTNSGVATPSSSIGMRTPTSTGGLTGRTGSLGSQQLISLHGMHFTSQKTPTTSNSNYSVNSIGGGATTSGIGGSSSSTLVSSEPTKGVNAIPPEEAGHDYGHPPPPPAHVVALAAAARARMAAGADDIGGGGVKDPLTALRLTPRAVPRPRIMTPVMRSPSSMSTHSSPQTYGASNGISSSPSIPPHHSSSTSSPSSIPSFQRAGIQSGMQPRLGPRGAAAAAAAAGGGVMGGERSSAASDAVTDGEIQATVHNIMLEAAQKECANGKRTTMPIDLLRERDNGIANHQSFVGPSVKSVLSTHYSVCRPSMSSEGGTSSTVVQSPTCRQAVDSTLAKTPILASLTAPPSSSSSFPSFSSEPSTSFAASPSTSSSFFGVPTPSLPSSNLISNSSSVSSLSLNDDMMRDLLFMASQQQQQQQQQQQSPAVPPPIPSTSSSRPQQRQYVLQPEGMSYAEYRPDNPLSFKSFTSEGIPLQYSVSPEELYDQGVLARPSTSGGGGGTGNGMNGSNGGSAQNSSSLASYSYPQQSTQVAAAAAASQLGVPSSFTIQSSSNIPRGNDNGETPSMNRDDVSYLQSSQLHRPSMTSSAVVHPSSSSEVTDILEQSCLELR